MNRDDFKRRISLKIRRQDDDFFSGETGKETDDFFSTEYQGLEEDRQNIRNAVFDDFDREEERNRSSFRKGTLLGFLVCLCFVFVATLVLLGNGTIRISRFSTAGEFSTLESKILNIEVTKINTLV